MGFVVASGAMRACVRVLGLVGPLGGCFVDPGNSTVGGMVSAGSTGTSTGGAGTTVVGTTGETGAPTTTGTEGGESGSTTTAAATTGALSGSSGVEGSSSEGSTGDASTGATSTGGVELPVAGCEPLFFADFSDDPSRVLQLAGSWTWNAQPGTLTVQTKEGESSVAVTLESWKDVVVHTRVRVSSGYAVVRARHGDQLFNQPNYFGSMHPWTDKLQLGRNVNGNGTVFVSPTYPTDPALWYTLTLGVQGNELSFGVDDQVLAGAKDGQLLDGRVSIGGYGTGVAEFDWLLVCAAD